MPPNGSLDVGDIYMVLDGGMSGNESVVMKPFQGKDKCTKRFHISRTKTASMRVTSESVASASSNRLSGSPW